MIFVDIEIVLNVRTNNVAQWKCHNDDKKNHKLKKCNIKKNYTEFYYDIMIILHGDEIFQISHSILMCDEEIFNFGPRDRQPFLKRL